MPVQINELVIRANIKESSGENQQGATTQGAGGIDKEEIIRECAALVMEMINTKKER